MIARLGLVIACLAVSACAVRGGEASDPKIVGGTLVASDDILAKHVAAITTTEGKLYCSAFLIGKRTLATAAHCLKDTNTQFGVRVVFGIKTSEGTAFTASSWERHEKYAQDNVGPVWDAALIHLAEDVPETVGVPVKIGGDIKSYQPYQMTFEFAGFGLPATTGAAADAGILRRTTVEHSGHHLDVGIPRFFTDSLANPPHNVCYMDSGSPVFVQVDGERRAIGIASAIITTLLEKCESGLAMITYLPGLGWAAQP